MLLPLVRGASLAFLTLLGLLAVGCPPDDGSLPQTFPILDEVKGSTPAEGAVGLAPTSSGEVVRICLILPSSGPSKDIGAEIRRGVSIAQAEVAKRTGDARRFEWTEKDTKSTEPGALAAFQECFNEGHPVVIGPVHPAATTALIPVAAAHQAVLIIPEVGAAVPSLWADHLFAIAPPATQMGRIAGVDARQARKLKKAAVLHVPSVFGEGLRDAFSKAFLEGEPGASIVGAKELAPDQPDAWVAAARALIAQGAEALFVVGPPDPSKAIAALVSDPASTTHVWFVDWSMHPPVLAAAGEAGRSRVHWVNRSVTRGEFEALYVARYQARPEYSAGSGYDAATVAIRGALAAKSPYWEEIAAAIKGMKDIPSAFGVGSMAVYENLVYEDVAGYRLIEATQLPESEEWIFGGFE